MNDYVQAYPNDTIVPGQHACGARAYDWDYDFQNVPELRGTDFWSEGGGTLLYWTKYEMAAAAIRKIDARVAGLLRGVQPGVLRAHQRDPTHVRPTPGARSSSSSRPWSRRSRASRPPRGSHRQNIFYDQNVYGEKIFHRIQDYPYNDFFAFQDLYFLNTMSCGSEWACYDGTQWRYYDLNGTTGHGRTPGR